MGRESGELRVNVAAVCSYVSGKGRSLYWPFLVCGREGERNGEIRDEELQHTVKASHGLGPTFLECAWLAMRSKIFPMDAGAFAGPGRAKGALMSSLRAGSSFDRDMAAVSVYSCGCEDGWVVGAVIILCSSASGKQSVPT